MARRHAADTCWWVLVVLLVLWPVMMIFMMPGGHGVIGPSWFWLLLLVSFWILLGIGARRPVPVAEETGPRLLHESEQPAVVREVMRVDVATEQPEGTRIFRGRLNQPADSAYARLRTALGGDTVPLLQQDEMSPAAIVLTSKPVERKALARPVRLWLHWLLFALTIAITTWAGAAHQGVDVTREPARILAGLPYSLTLMAILGVHELGHYFTARHHGIRVTPPYFIPVPMALGTFGAFIQMRSPIEHRRALFDVALAGPLAGLAVAIPALLVGLRTSTILSLATCRRCR